jgi:phosphoribosylformylglycinamidine synthase
MLPGSGDAAIIRLRNQDFGVGDVELSPLHQSTIGVAATVDCNARYVYLDPYEGAKLAVAEAARNLSCVGAEPLAVTDNLNFGSPEHNTGYWQLAEACRGIAEACRELGTPVTGGNVSLYNETIDSDGNAQPIYPTPVIGTIGLVPDITKTCGQAWQAVGDTIYLLGSDRTTLAASEYLAVILGQVTGRPVAVDFDIERRVQAVCRYGIARGWVRSAHDCAEGGLAVAIAESCISSNLTAHISLSGQAHPHNILFGEGPSRIVVSVSSEHHDRWEEYLQAQLAGLWQAIGHVTESSANLAISIAGADSGVNLPLEQLIHAYTEAIPRRMQTDSATEQI